MHRGKFVRRGLLILEAAANKTGNQAVIVRLFFKSLRKQKEVIAEAAIKYRQSRKLTNLPPINIIRAYSRNFFCFIFRDAT